MNLPGARATEGTFVTWMPFCVYVGIPESATDFGDDVGNVAGILTFDSDFVIKVETVYEDNDSRTLILHVEPDAPQSTSTSTSSSLSSSCSSASA